MTELTATINTRHLLDALKRAETVRQDHHVRAIATAQIHFGEKSKVVVTDLDQELTLPVEAESAGKFIANIYPPTAITALGNVNGPCEFQCIDGTTHISTKAISLNGPKDVEPEDLLKFKSFTAKAEFEISECALHKALRSVAFAVSTEETRYYLNGIFLTHIEGELTMVATDGIRLSRYKLGQPYSGPQVIIAHPTVKALLKLLQQNSKSAVRVSIGETRATFAHQKWTLKTKTIDGKFPDWQRVIPKTTPTIRAVLTQAHVSRLPKHDDWRHPVISPDIGKIEIADSYGGGSIEMPIEGEGEPFCLAGNYLRQMIGIVGNVTLYGSSPDAPFLATTSDDRVLVVQMPMKIPAQKS